MADPGGSTGSEGGPRPTGAPVGGQADPSRPADAPAQSAAGVPRPEPGPVDRGLAEKVDGLGFWLAELDRKLGVRTYAGTAVAILGLAVAILALILAIQTQDDAATKGQLEAAESRVLDLERRSDEAAGGELETRIDDLEGRLARLESSSARTDRQLDALRDDLNALSNRVERLEEAN